MLKLKMLKLKSLFNTNKLKKFKDFLKFKSLRTHFSNKFFIYFIVLLVPLLLLAFQNCKVSNLDTSRIESEEDESVPPNTEGTENIDRGHIIRVDSESGDVIEDESLPINSDIKMQFINVDSNADNYKWTIKRGFSSIVSSSPTDTDTYQTKIPQQVGAYDVFANSYKSETFLRAASKRFVAGTSCSLTDVLEIELSSGSLQAGQSAIFSLKYSDEFSSTRWKATLPSGEVIEQTIEENTDTEEDPNTLELSFEDESAGILVIEVSASHVDRSACLTYRKQSLNVTSALRPHFNPIVVTDGSDEIGVMLENNDIYKYERPSSQYLQVEVSHADSCSYQVNQNSEADFTCSSGLIDISLNSDTDCLQNVINLSASISGSDEEVTHTYYNFCPKDDDYCYLGYNNERQYYHLCSREIASQGREFVDGVCDNSVRNGCTSGTANDSAVEDTETHYTWHCEGSDGGNTASDCQIELPVNGVCDNSQRNSCTSGTANDSAVEDTPTHYKWGCMGVNGGTSAGCQKAKPINGVCNNSQRNSCSSGTANDSAVPDTSTHYKWSCVGANGGSTVSNCQIAKPAAVNGACNNTQRNSCTSGTANDSAVEDTTTHYRWSCVGAHGGTTVSNCQIARPVNGVCKNSQRNGCRSGTANDPAVADTTTHYKWSCVGRNGGTTVNNCQILRGVCGDNVNTCISGIVQNVDDSDTQRLWNCIGANSDSDTNDHCSAPLTARVDGVCKDVGINGCTSGRYENVPDTATQRLWNCTGFNGGSTDNCSTPK